jgi:catechol 2,3-dioxygenase-like lactoylglutathione lyase family enzyme
MPPALRAVGVHHVGVAVADMDETLVFYRDVLGVEPDFDAEFSGSDVLSELLDVPDAHVRMVMLSVGGARVELLHYLSPTGRSNDRDPSDQGVAHIALEVEDIDEAVGALAGHGIACTTDEPFRVDEGPTAGTALAYFRGPDRVQFELFQPPRDGA